ncbi:MAG: diphthine synthase [Candidatus Caldarchaeum sp.]
MTLVFIGGGLGSPSSLTLGAVEALKSCDVVYIDCYTSFWDERTLEYVEGLAKSLVKSYRRMLEEEAHKVVAEARTKVVGVLAPGDPFIATTHSSMMEMAARKGVKVEVVNGVSIISAAISLSGLHVYKFGKTATLPKTEDPALYTQPVNIIEENLSRQAHTLLLLDTADGGLSVDVGLKRLMQAAEKMGKRVVGYETLAIALARVGHSDQVLKAGRVEDLLADSYPPPPHCLIIPSALHFSEKEAVKTYALNPDAVEKTVPPNPVADRITRYLDKCRQFIRRAGGFEHLKQYVNYVKCYVEDAEKFMQSGDVVNALLSVGYAEGLLYALRLRGEVDFEW